MGRRVQAYGQQPLRRGEDSVCLSKVGLFGLHIDMLEILERGSGAGGRILQNAIPATSADGSVSIPIYMWSVPSDSVYRKWLRTRLRPLSWMMRTCCLAAARTMWVLCDFFELYILTKFQLAFIEEWLVVKGVVDTDREKTVSYIRIFLYYRSLRWVLGFVEL